MNCLFCSLDHRVSSLPSVTSGRIGAYLGAPLRNSSGAMVGVLCVLDDSPRIWTLEQLRDVSRIADEIVVELQRICDQA